MMDVPKLQDFTKRQVGGLTGALLLLIAIAFFAYDFDAIFVGTGAPRGRDLEIPGRKEGAANIHIGIDWLSSVSFGHIKQIGKRVIVLGGGNTAMDCCRSSLRV